MAAKKSSATRSMRRAKTPLKKPSPKAESVVFPIVAIGASAGGLKAFEQFFANMPPESGVGFVLVPHLDPNHASMLPDLLKKIHKNGRPAGRRRHEGPARSRPCASAQ